MKQFQSFNKQRDNLHFEHSVLNMLRTDDSDLSYLLVQASALFEQRMSEHGVGTDARLLWIFSLLPQEERFDGRPGLLA